VFDAGTGIRQLGKYLEDKDRASWEEAALTARQAMIDKLYLIHHDPDRSDAALEAILNDARQVFPETEVAIESSSFEVV
jgi:ribonuclease BN (tRNA processing enzyme)